jgi:hypothetical protein
MASQSLVNGGGLTPYPVRPNNTVLEVFDDRQSFTFSGALRVLVNGRGIDNLNVVMKFNDRSGNDLNDTLSLEFYMLGGGLKDEFYCKHYKNPCE